MSKKPKAYSYIRFSTTEQKDGDSLRRQMQATKAWCRENGVELFNEMQELGVSAFRGKHRMVGVLAEFLKLVEGGRIPKGSYLLIENLDRLSREKVLEALELYTKIIRVGVTIVTLIDKQVHSKETIGANPMILQMAICSMVRGNEESELKSKRIAEAWGKKRADLGQKKMTAKCPSWLKLSKDRKSFAVIPEKVQIVRRIFRMSADGKGRNFIAKTFNRESVPCLGYAKYWHTSTLNKLLRSRTTLGEFTPHSGSGKDRKPLDPAPNYYPAVISPSLFAKVQQIRKARPKFNGAGTYNAFVGITKDAKTGETISYINKKRAKGWHYLVPTSCTTGNRKWITWQYDEFKSMFLAVCRQARAGVGDSTAEEKRLAEILAETEQAKGKIDMLLDNLQSIKSDSAAKRLETLEDKLNTLAEEREECEERIANQNLVIDLPLDEEDPARLRDAVGRNVRSLKVDIEDKSFRCEMHNGLFYNARLRDGVVDIETSDATLAKAI